MALLRINRHPSRSQLLLFALAWLVVVGAVALQAWLSGRVWSGGVVAVLALAVPALWAVAPEFTRWVFLGLSYATYPIGFVLSYVVLAIMYYGVFTPAGLVMRLCRRDPLLRRFDPNATTYWEQRPKPPPPGSYLRQQ